MAPPIGLQLYTLRAQLAEDFESTIRRVADIGYAGVEFGGFYGESPAAAANLCHALGLEICSMHSHSPLMASLTLTVDTAQTLGVKRVVCPWYPPEQLAAVDNIKQVCDELNTANEIMRGNNLAFGYHNHWAECYREGDQYAYQYMAAFLDPAVFFEVDVYWAKTAGVDPAVMLHELGTRAPLLHIKDGPATMEGDMTAVGEGVVDFSAISQASKDTAAWWIVELDRCATDMMQAVDKSYQYITGRGFAHGRK